MGLETYQRVSAAPEQALPEHKELDEPQNQQAFAIDFEKHALLALRNGEVPAALRAYRPEHLQSEIDGNVEKLHDILDPSAAQKKIPTVVKVMDYYKLRNANWREYSSFIVDCAGSSYVNKKHF
jgi:hypothetical protein